MSEVASAYVSLIPSAKGFGKGVSKVVDGDLASAGKSGGKKLGSGIFTSAKSFVAPLAALFAVSAGVAFFKGAIDGASDLSESASKVGVVFGKQADQIMAASETSASAMGLSKAAYLGATGTLGNLLVSLKIAPQAAADMSQEMVKLAGDMASFNNVPIEDALAALKSGLTGETEPLKAFGVNMNDATLKASALKLGLIKTTKDAMTPQTKALAAQALIMDQTGTAQGDFGRTSAGLANQQRILAAQFEDVKAKIGAVLLPAMTGAVTFLSTNLMPAFDEASGGVKALVAAFKAGGNDITSSGFAGGMERVGLASRAFVENTKDFAAGMREHSTALLGAAGVITTVFIPALLRLALTATISGAETIAIWAMLQAASIASTASSAAAFFIQNSRWVVSAAIATASGLAIAAAWLISIWPIALVIAAVVGLGVLIWKNMDKIKVWVSAAWNWISATTKTVWGAISGFLTGFWAGVVSGFSSAWSAVTGFVSGAWASFTGFVGRVAGAALQLLDWITYPFRIGIAIVIGLVLILAKAVTGLVTWMVGGIVAAWDGLWAFIAPIVTTIKDFIVGAWTATVAAVTGLVTAIVTTVTARFNAIKAVVTSIMTTVQGAISSAWNTISTTIATVAGRIWGVVSGAFNRIKDAISGAMGAAVGASTTLITNVLNSIKSVIGGLLAVVSGPFNSIKGAITGAIGGAVSAASGLISKVMDAIKSGISDVVNIGSDIVSGLINGITGSAGRLWSAITSFIANNVPAPVRKLLGIASPSKVFAELGKNTAEGFIVGIDGTQSDVAASMKGLVSLPRVGSLDFASSADRASAMAGSGSGSSPDLLAEVQGLRADIRALPRAYQLGQRQYA